MLRSVFAATLALTLIGAWGTRSTAQEAPRPPQPDETKSPRTHEEIYLDELRELAREDLEVWQSRVVARQSWVREAAKRVDVANAYRAAIEARLKQGIETRNNLDQADLELVELQARLDQKRLELKEAEVRTARARRRVEMLKKVDRYTVVGGPLAEFLAPNAAQFEERIADLEGQLERVRAELDEARARAKAIFTDKRQK